MKNANEDRDDKNWKPSEWTGSTLILAPPFKPGTHNGKFGESEYVEVGLVVLLDDNYKVQESYRKQWVWAAGIRGMAEGPELVTGRLMSYDTKYGKKAVGVDELHAGEFSAVSSWADQNMETLHGLWYLKEQPGEENLI